MRRYTLYIVTLKLIEVECYAGSRADQTPRRVHIEGRSHMIRRLLGESIEESLDKRTRAHRYRLLTDEGLVLEIIRADGGKWFLKSITRDNQ